MGLSGAEAAEEVGGPAPVEVWRWTLQPGDDYPSHPHQPGVVETVSVTTATFASDVAHTYRGAGIEPCELTMTVHLPSMPSSTT